MFILQFEYGGHISSSTYADLLSHSSLFLKVCKYLSSSGIIRNPVITWIPAQLETFHFGYWFFFKKFITKVIVMFNSFFGILKII